MSSIELKSRAKINLSIDVLGKREDGYHLVEMIMQTIDLYDLIEINEKDNDQITIKSTSDEIPLDCNNLVYKAANLIKKTFNINKGVEIHIKKNIPVAAGMAGGSSNAAAVLYGMNKMFDLKLTQTELMERGVKLGADVPYCIMRGTVLAEGIGEELTTLTPMPKCFVLIAKPPISVSTKVVYEALDSKELVEHPDIDGLIEGLEKRDLKTIASCMGNVLEDVTIPMHPVIEEIKQEMKNAGALNAMMSGSGPTVFGLFETKAAARKAQDRIRRRALAKQVYVTNVHGAGRN